VGADGLRRLLSDWAQILNLPSAVVHAAGPGGQLSFAWGVVSGGEAPDLDTRYGIGSATKPFTAVGVLAAVEAGAVALDDQVTDVLGSSHPILRGVTVHHLLSHSSGLPGLDSRWHAADPGAADPFSGGYSVSGRRSPLGGWGGAGHGFVDHRGYLAYLDALDIDRVGEPGQWASYSNDGYILLGGVIAEATGRTYQDHIRQSVIEPLGLTATTFVSETLGDHLADPLIGGPSGPARVPWWRPPGWDPSGGLITSARDLMSFAKSLLPRSHRLLSDETLRTMRTPHAVFPSGAGAYGHGLVIERSPDDTAIVGHGGSRAGCSAWLLCEVERGDVAVGLVNYDVSPFPHAARAALNVLAGREPGLFWTQDRPPADQAPPLDLLTGTYHYMEHAPIVVEFDGRQLSVTSPAFEFLRQVDQSTSFVTEAGETIRFLFGPAGEPLLARGLFVYSSTPTSRRKSTPPPR
jgi:CubicO group peptidase (beta-lactamase class C family)